MFSYMIDLNDAESFLVAYSNYETVKKLKNVERRLSQQMVMNDTLFLTLFLLFRSIIRAAEVSSGFEPVWKQNEVKTSFDLS